MQLFDAATDGTQGGDGGKTTTATTDATQTTTEATTLLAQTKTDAAAATAAADKAKADPLAAYPERFRVFKDDKTLDLEKTAIKGFESYTQLEKRMKDVGLPPDSADGYDFKPPDGIELDAELTKGFKAKAHEAGLTKKQFDLVMNSYIEQLGRLPEQMDALMAGRAKETRPLMVKAFGGESGFKEGMQHASRAVDALFADAPEEVKANADHLGNSPAFLWMAAKFGREMQEDQSILISQRLSPQSEIDTLMKDMKSAYWNPLDPGHEAAKIKVSRHMEAQAKLAQHQRN